MKKILIDLIKYRECTLEGCNRPIAEGLLPGNPETGGLKPIREIAVFAYSCRRCKDAPCVEVCPEEALKKDENGMIIRSTNLCVGCKSCVTICPFGTMMSDFYEYKRTDSLYFNIRDEKELERFVKESPDNAVRFTDEEQDASENIFELMPGVLVRDYPWEKIKSLE